MKWVCGFDPGYFGGLAFYNPGAFVSVYDMPLSFDKHKKKSVDGYALKMILDAHRADLAFAAIERVHAMPGQGVTSMFHFGEGLGVIKGVLSALSIPFIEVEPSVWKGVLGLGPDKKKSLDLARKVFGNVHFPKMKDNGKAEAALIAKFAYERLGKGYGI